MIQRMIRAASLDVSLYEEVEHDLSATRQALQVVVLVSLLSGIGQGLGDLSLGRLVFGILGSLVGWAAWSFVTYWIGTKLYAGTATYGELLRTIGFASSPGALNIFAFVPLIGGILSLAVGIWTLVAGVIAVRQALDFSTGKAILTTGVGWLLMVVVYFVLGLFAAVLR